MIDIVVILFLIGASISGIYNIISCVRYERRFKEKQKKLREEAEKAGIHLHYYDMP